tara:strand:- start:2200 stop:3267 length:1068 start_codon:yes stop_codon:yes gene_type:complete
MAEDFTTINNPRFLYLAELSHPFPDWVVSEPIPAKSAFEKKAAAAFADVHRRLLPISTKSAAFHSAINIFAHMDEFDDAVFERVKEACAFFGISGDVAPYAGIFADEVEKSASENEFPEGRFAIDTTLNEESFQLLPINDREDVISSAFDLAKMASDNRIHLLMMVPAAREIVKAAADYGADGLPELIVRFGGEKFSDLEEATRLIEGREQFCKDATIRETIAADYKEALTDVEENPDTAMEKIAAIDMAAGLQPNYRIASLVPTPFDIVFSGPLDSEAEKAAKSHVLVRNVLVPLEEVKRIEDMDAKFKLSKSASEAFSKIRECDDARDLSLTIEQWEEKDQRTLLRLAVDAAV